MAKSFTSISSGKAPESSMVLKKIGAMVLPITKPPVRLFGAQGMSWPRAISWKLIQLQLCNVGMGWVKSLDTPKSRKQTSNFAPFNIFGDGHCHSLPGILLLKYPTIFQTTKTKKWLAALGPWVPWVPGPCTTEWNWLLTFVMSPCQPRRQHRPGDDPSCDELTGQIPWICLKLPQKR